MKRFGILVISAFIILTLSGCDKREETPPEVLQAYDHLLSALDPDRPGESYATLQQFASDHSQYDVAAIVELELKNRHKGLEAAYFEGRDLAREEQFDEAETVLSDLAMNLPDESAGRLAREYLQFEFPFMKASRLLMRGDVAGAENVARELLGKQLTGEQMLKAQNLLDSISTTSIGVNMAHSASLMSAARMLQAHIDAYYAEWGRYPEALDLESPEFASLSNSFAFERSVEAIEDYTVTDDGFSLVITGKHLNERLRMTEAGVKNASHP